MELAGCVVVLEDRAAIHATQLHGMFEHSSEDLLEIQRGAYSLTHNTKSLKFVHRLGQLTGAVLELA